jgi:thioredoxin 1
VLLTLRLGARTAAPGGAIKRHPIKVVPQKGAGMAGRLRSVTDETFADEVLKSNKPVPVDFWAAWCGPCRLVTPILTALATEHSDKITIVQLNVDESPRTAEKYGVRSIPTLNVYRDGKVVKTIVGAKPRRVLEQDLQEFLR